MTTPIASSIRPGLRDTRQPSSGSPHTPSRFISSNFSSPGSSFRQEEDVVIIELGARYLRAGFEGESGPQCCIPFNIENSRRMGDYMDFAAGYESKSLDFEEWADRCELWRSDLKNVDLGLVEDKLERAVREVYSKYLLTDAGTARLVMVLPSVVPHPILATVLTALFDRWNYSTISLLPGPTMAAISAGVRSALVVDIGWEETIVTTIYEYRELKTMRTTRGMKMMVGRLGEALTAFAKQNSKEGGSLKVDYNFVEELVNRSPFCTSPTGDHEGEAQLEKKTESLSLDQEKKDVNEDVNEGEDTNEEKIRLPDHKDLSSEIEVDWPSGTTYKPVNIPASLVRDCAEKVFCVEEVEKNHLDDHERTLSEVIYNSLLSQEPDVRGMCMARIIFIGGGANIAGLSSKIFAEAEILVEKHGWTSVRGKRLDDQRKKLGELSQGRTKPPLAKHDIPLPTGKDYVEEKLQKRKAKNAYTQASGEFRQIYSLGPWAGASLLASLKVKGFVEVERERYLSHGLSGASREGEVVVVPQRMSSLGISAVKNSDRTSWTLAGWG